jgi:hypothetical protein
MNFFVLSRRRKMAARQPSQQLAELGQTSGSSRQGLGQSSSGVQADFIGQMMQF